MEQEPLLGPLSAQEGQQRGGSMSDDLPLNGKQSRRYIRLATTEAAAIPCIGSASARTPDHTAFQVRDASPLYMC